MDEQMDVAAVIAAEVEEVSHEARFDDLDRRIRELEAAMGDMRTVAAQAAVPAGRKTALSASMSAAAKGESETDRGAALDASLSSLSVEQRIAVKSGMMRAGLL